MEGHVYLIGESDKPKHYKIGVTKKKNINERINELQTGNSDELFLRTYFKTNYPYKLEKSLHRHFSKQHILNEWYELTEDDVKTFKDICLKYENIFNSLKENPFFI